MIKLKNKAHKKYLKSRMKADKDYYIDIKNYVNSAIKREKTAYMKFQLNSSNKDQKKLWNNLKKWGIHNPCTSSLDKLPEGNINVVNDYFINVAGESQVNNELHAYFRNNRFIQNEMVEFKFKEINEDDIYAQLKQIKSNAYGVDGINLKMLNVVIPYCIQIVINIINKSLSLGTVPDIWKSALILPIPKISNPIELNHLRPINILPTFSKLLEKLVSIQFSDYLTSYNIMPRLQSGFRQGHSTSTALIKVVNDIAKNMDNSEITFLVLLDQSKAFDLVNFNLLISKLNYIGVDGVELLWFKNYLNHRSQRVKFNDEYSNSRVTKNGVPQGSILGPILFSTFMLDVPPIFRFSSLHMYADDIQIYISCKASEASVRETINNLNSDLEAFSIWCKENGLRINPQKSVTMCIGNEVLKKPLDIESYDIIVNKDTIKYVQQVKNLGVIIDSSLNFNAHVNNVTKQSFMTLKALYQFKHSLSEDVKMTLMRSLIYPKIDYGSNVYFNFLAEYNKNKLQRIQNACMRFSYCIDYRAHITPHLNNIKELNIRHRMKYLFSIFTYKLHKTATPIYLYELLTKRSDIHDVNIRNNKYNIPQHHTSKFEGCFTYMAAVVLNENFHLLSLSEYQFKSKIKEVLSNMQL